MQAVKRVFDFYIFSNIHVALAVFSLTKITLLEYSVESNLLPFFTLFSTLVSYNLIRIYKVSEIQHWTFQFVKQHKKGILGLTFLSLCVVVYLSVLLKLVALLAMIPFALFTLFYVVPIPIKKNSTIALRNIAFLKLFLIAISWAGVTVLVPLLNYNIDLHGIEVVTFVQRFLFVVVITIPFDIRDVNFDSVKLKTIPQVIGVQQSKVFGLLFLLLFLGLEFFKGTTEVIPFRNHLLIAVLSLIFLFRATTNQHKYYSAFFVESLPIIWLLLVL